MRHLIFASLFAFLALPVTAADLISFWDTPRHGGNSFNRLAPDQAYFNALRAYGATWVRLSYDKWQPAQRDFLLGSADDYQGLPATDVVQLRAVLDRAHLAGLKVVIAPLSLPGMRWSQNNQGQVDDRLWRDLARELKDHPAIAAYNLITEPAPEQHGGLAEHAAPEQMKRWYAQAQGTARDLPALYEQLVAAIREQDPDTPIMVDAGWYAAADAFGYWPAPLADSRALDAQATLCLPRPCTGRRADAAVGWPACAAIPATTAGLERSDARATLTPSGGGVRLHAPVARLPALPGRRSYSARQQPVALGVLQLP